MLLPQLSAVYKTYCWKKASESRGSYSLHTERLKVKDNTAHVLFTVWSEKHKLHYYIYTETGTNTEADGGVIQTGPTDNLPSSSGAPGLAFSSNTKRRRSKRGRGREKENRT